MTEMSGILVLNSFLSESLYVECRFKSEFFQAKFGQSIQNIKSL